MYNQSYIFVSEGLVGVALTGGIVLGIAGVVGLAFALAKKWSLPINNFQASLVNNQLLPPFIHQSNFVSGEISFYESCVWKHINQEAQKIIFSERYWKFLFLHFKSFVLLKPITMLEPQKVYVTGEIVKF